jgi:hypothetical protein
MKVGDILRLVLLEGCLSHSQLCHINFLSLSRPSATGCTSLTIHGHISISHVSILSSSQH